MARPVYSIIIAAGSGFSGVGVPYTVPAGYTVVIRDSQCTLGFELPVPQGFFGFQIGGGFYYLPSLGNSPVANPTTFSWEGRIVCREGEVITPFCHTVTCDFRLSGYLLTSA